MPSIKCRTCRAIANAFSAVVEMVKKPFKKPKKDKEQ